MVCVIESGEGMSLPRLAELEYAPEEIEQETTESGVQHVTFDWDFEKGDFVLKDGKLIELTEMDYLKIWIEKALRTERKPGKEYGSEHFRLLGTVFKPSFTREEYKRYIREALLLNSAITGVSNFEFEQIGSKMIIHFDVASIYGNFGEEVTV